MESRDTNPQQRRALISAHNWHSWSVPPSARVSFELAAPALDTKLTQESRTAAQSMVDLLCDLGLSTFFGLPGGPVIPVFDAILTNPRARLIEPRHEAYGTFAAMGYHRASGKVPVVVVTAGPGATNAISGIVAAHLERVPLLLISGDVPGSASGRRMFQDTGEYGVGIERMLSGVTRLVTRVTQPASASSQVRAAVQAATNPDHPGPALLIISIDRAGQRAFAPQVHGAALDATPYRQPPDAGLLRTVSGLLQTARQPLILVGAGCRRDAGRVQQLVEASGIPFVTTPQAKGVISEEHPLSLRNCGVGASEWARRYLASPPDVTLALGSDLDDMSTAGASPVGPGGTLIHVDLDATVFARNFPTAIGAVYDIGTFTGALTNTVAAWTAPRDGQGLIHQVREVSPFNEVGFATDEAMPLPPHRAVADLMKAVGPRVNFVTDIGEHTLFALHYLTATTERRFVIHLGLGSMGSGISSAIGLALGDPSRRVVCICGDGGMQMAGMEILVALKLRLPIIYAVFNDARYNMVYHGYRMTYGREAAWDSPLVDFARWGDALGARGRLIERPGEITRALLDELSEGGVPVVLDIRHDAGVRLRNAGRAESLKQILEGQG